MKAKLLMLLMLSLPVLLGAQTIDRQQVDKFAVAIAHAEGFGFKRTIPSRYHNPGDMKSRATAVKLPGQKSIGKGGHIVFSNDRAGWAALKDQIAKMVDGRSKHFNADMTIAQVGRVYAVRWRPWVAIVTSELNVEATTKLRDLLCEPEPPAIRAQLPKLRLPEITPTMPVLAEDNQAISANLR
jgi:hypothetical protein